jgi:MFS family permease
VSNPTKRDVLLPFRHRDFAFFWTGSFVSSMGSQFTTVAMVWQIYELTDSPLQIGLLGLARALPQMILLLFAGLLADTMNPRKPMMFTQSGLCCVSLTLSTLLLPVTSRRTCIMSRPFSWLFSPRSSNRHVNR